MSKSTDGIHFTSLGTLDPSLGAVEILFAWKNDIYLRTKIEGLITYLKSSDGIHFESFLPKNKYDKYLSPLAFGVVRDTLYAYCMHFQKGNDTWRDSLYYMDKNKQWQSSYGKLYSETYTTLSASGQLLLTSAGGYLNFTSLLKAPKVIPKTSISFNPQRWSVGQYILSFDPFYYQNGKSAMLITDLKGQTTTPMNLPQDGLSQDEFSLLVLPDSSIIIKNRKVISTPEYPYISYSYAYHSSDYGVNWSIVDSFPTYWKNISYMSTYQFKNTWYITNNTLPYFSSTDKGANWNKCMLYGTRWNTSFVSADGKMSMNGTFFSKDDGSTWQTYTEAFPGYTPTEIFWRDNKLGWFIQNSDNSYYQIKPGSNTPVYAGNNATYYKEALLTNNQIYYLYKGGYADFSSGDFYKLNQSNFQWNKINDMKLAVGGDPAMYMMADESYLYYYDVENSIVKGVYVSSDGGLNWNLLAMPAPLVTSKKPIYSFYDDRNNGLYIGMRESDGTTSANSTIDTLRIFRLASTGYTPVAANGFVKQPLRNNLAHPAFQNLIRFQSGALYSWSQDNAKTMLSVYKSVDEGENWEKVDTDTFKNVVINIGEDLKGRLYIATNNGLYREKVDDDPILTNIFHSTFAENKLIKLYPNPTSGSVSISGNDIQSIQIIDLLGNVCIQTSTIEDTIYILNISSLSAGMYIVKTNIGSEKLLVR